MGEDQRTLPCINYLFQQWIPGKERARIWDREWDRDRETFYNFCWDFLICNERGFFFFLEKNDYTVTEMTVNGKLIISSAIGKLFSVHISDIKLQKLKE